MHTGVRLTRFGTWAVSLLGRPAWLGPDFAIARHQMHNGALLLFAVFMISDPVNILNVRRARLAYAAIVALNA